MTKPLFLLGNWKMYLSYAESLALADVIATSSDTIASELTTAVFPGALAAHAVAKRLSATPVRVGAQTIGWVDKGAYTGEISAPMYQEVGASYALIGHSERRHIGHETNQEVRQKTEAALAAGLVPVICVGETRDERESGMADEVIEAQIRAVFSGLIIPPNASCIVAYEPVWAINTGEACSPSEAAARHALIRRLVLALVPGIKLSIVYGGSVTAENAPGFCSLLDIDGVLVGGGSVKADSWQHLVEALSV